MRNHEITEFVQMELQYLSRRFRGMAMISRGIVPNLVISDQVITRIASAAQKYIEDETGEAMVGLVLKNDESPESMPTIYVLDTISPDETAVRRTHTFQQGDELQQDIFVWLLENWETYRDIGRDHLGKALDPKFDVPLSHLGDWHKQPGYMIQPSGGDLMTALNIMDEDENALEFLLVPIVTLGHPQTTFEDGARVNYFTVPMDDGTSIRVDWWYIHRDVRVFQPIFPEIVPSDELPILTPYPWHLLDEDRMLDEVGRMNHDGLFVSVVVWEADGDLPMEICFMAARQGSDKVLLIITDWNYPYVQPKVRVAPFLHFGADSDMFEVFEQLWEHSEAVEPPGHFVWDEEAYLIDLVVLIEDKLGIRPDEPAQPVEQLFRQDNLDDDEGEEDYEDYEDYTTEEP